MNKLKILSLIICLAWNNSASAESEETGADNPFGKSTVNRFSKYAPDPENTPSGHAIPPLSHPKLKQPKPEKVITEYFSNIKPGDKLPADVYECVLKNLRGIGSDAAAKLIWAACLRLHLN